jgi:hypothetical protein
MNEVSDIMPITKDAWQPLMGGRVNCLWKVGQIVVKQYAKNGNSPLFPNDPKAEVTALALLARSGLSPTLLAHGQDWIAYKHLPGHTWQADPATVATALKTLHAIDPLAMPLRVAPNGSVPLLTQAIAIANLCSGPLPPPPPDLSIPETSARLIHGDAVPGNMIHHNGKITLIDWQCPALGDPTEDIATFLSPAMQWLYRGSALTIQEISIFRTNIPAKTMARYDLLAPLYHWRMAAHCLWKSEQGATDYAMALQMELAALQALPQKYSR